MKNKEVLNNLENRFNLCKELGDGYDFLISLSEHVS